MILGRIHYDIGFIMNTASPPEVFLLQLVSVLIQYFLFKRLEHQEATTSTALVSSSDALVAGSFMILGVASCCCKTEVNN